MEAYYTEFLANLKNPEGKKSLHETLVKIQEVFKKDGLTTPEGYWVFDVVNAIGKQPFDPITDLKFAFKDSDKHVFTDIKLRILAACLHNKYNRNNMSKALKAAQSEVEAKARRMSQTLKSVKAARAKLEGALEELEESILGKRKAENNQFLLQNTIAMLDDDATTISDHENCDDQILQAIESGKRRKTDQAIESGKRRKTDQAIESGKRCKTDQA
jgi:hypothetical protein